MTADEFWRAVGESLLIQRKRRGWKPFQVEKSGGPNYKTVQDIEDGKVGNVTKLNQYAETLGLNVVDVMRSVLLEHQRPITPETLQLVRTFERTTVEGRQALLSMARALPDVSVTPLAPPQSLPDRPAPEPHKP